MAYYERDYFREPSPQRGVSMSAPRLLPVSKVLLFVVIGLNLLVWGMEGWADNIAATVSHSSTLKWLVLGPSALFPATQDAVIAPWQLITAGFIEPDLLGLVTSCLFIIWLLGSRIEEAVGSRRYAIFFLVAIFAGNLLSALLDPFIFGAIGGEQASLSIYRATLAPAGCAVMVASAMLFPNSRTFLDLPFKTVVYVLLAVYLAIVAVPFFSPTNAQNHAIASLTACVVGVFWGRLFVKAAIARGAAPKERVLRRVQEEPEEDYLSYAKQFSIDASDEEVIDVVGLSRQEEKRLQRETEERRKVDLLLARISGDGIESLSRAEKAFLDRYSKRQREVSKK